MLLCFMCANKYTDIYKMRVQQIIVMAISVICKDERYRRYYYRHLVVCYKLLSCEKRTIGGATLCMLEVYVLESFIQ